MDLDPSDAWDIVLAEAESAEAAAPPPREHPRRNVCAPRRKRRLVPDPVDDRAIVPHLGDDASVAEGGDNQGLALAVVPVTYKAARWEAARYARPCKNTLYLQRLKNECVEEKQRLEQGLVMLSCSLPIVKKSPAPPQYQDGGV